MHRPTIGVVRASTVVALAAALALTACGDTSTDAGADAGTGDGAHSLYEVPDDLPVPTVEIDVEPDPVSGINVHVDVTNYDVAPENASTEAVPGQGHFHVYLDGEKVARFYNRSIHLAAGEGEHTVRVELSANDHATYAVDGAAITAQAQVTVPAPADDHGHADAIAATDPVPTIDLAVTPDPKAGWNVHAAVTNLTFAPRSAGGDAVDGEGHLHLYVDGQKVARLYGQWWHLDPLPAGRHDITVEATANNHAPYEVDGEPVAATVTIDVSEAQAAAGSTAGHATGDDGHETDHHQAGTDGGDLLDITAGEADTLIEIVVAAGKVEREATRFEVDEGSTVGVVVVSDRADRVHLHGYEILMPVGPDGPVEFAFTADAAGVFEVELEDEGVFLFDLQVG